MLHAYINTLTTMFLSACYLPFIPRFQQFIAKFPHRRGSRCAAWARHRNTSPQNTVQRNASVSHHTNASSTAAVL